MKTYRISISDRQRNRIIRADRAVDAIRVAIGERFINARENSVSMRGDVSHYEVAVATGPTRNGNTPFRDIAVIVTLED